MPNVILSEAKDLSQIVISTDYIVFHLEILRFAQDDKNGSRRTRR
jgi:hypothetical protein